METSLVHDLTAEDLSFALPDPDDEGLGDSEFHQQLDQAWQVCDRFDLQTEIWRGRILRTVRDREKRGGDNRGTTFLNWLKDREISKSRAYALIDLANQADQLLDSGHLDPGTVNQFSKRAFLETAQASPEVQQMIGDAARDGHRITRHQVKQVADEWTAVTSDLLPEPVREKAMDHSLPVRYVAPLVKEMAKLPDLHRAPLQADVAETPDVDTVKQTTATARYLARYLESAAQLQTLVNVNNLDVEQALEEALRLNCLNIAADVLSQAAQVEQALAKFHNSWKRLGSLSERLYVESGSSTPHLRSLLTAIEALAGEHITLQIGEASTSRTLQLQVISDALGITEAGEEHPNTSDTPPWDE
ncbi:MAG: hypothetical protein ACO3EZ_02235 [Prochlorotrichaceae cyanobacterium]